MTKKLTLEKRIRLELFEITFDGLMGNWYGKTTQDSKIAGD